MWHVTDMISLPRILTIIPGIPVTVRTPDSLAAVGHGATALTLPGGMAELANLRPHLLNQKAFSQDLQGDLHSP